MLVALALILLVFGATDGKIVSKCELKEKLDAAQIPLIRAMGDKMTADNLVAILVCKAGVSGFNTSFVKNITGGPKETKGFVRQSLYGLFQLSDQLTCDSGMRPSLNVCNISCSALIDDDVTDDIACLKTVISSIKPKPKEKPSEITLPLATLNTILVNECRSVDPSQYFSECLTAAPTNACNFQTV